MVPPSMKSVKYIAIFLAIISFNVCAETADEVCLKQAMSLVQQLNTEVFADMDLIQREKTLKISTENCKKYFNPPEKKQANIAIDDKKTESKNENEEDSFTQKILTGEIPDKAGNKRLKRLRHK